MTKPSILAEIQGSLQHERAQQTLRLRQLILNVIAVVWEEIMHIIKSSMCASLHVLQMLAGKLKRSTEKRFFC